MACISNFSTAFSAAQENASSQQTDARNKRNTTWLGNGINPDAVDHVVGVRVEEPIRVDAVFDVSVPIRHLNVELPLRERQIRGGIRRKRKVGQISMQRVRIVREIELNDLTQIRGSLRRGNPEHVKAAESCVDELVRVPSTIWEAVDVPLYKRCRPAALVLDLTGSIKERELNGRRRAEVISRLSARLAAGRQCRWNGERRGERAAFQRPKIQGGR